MLLGRDCLFFYMIRMTIRLNIMNIQKKITKGN